MKNKKNFKRYLLNFILLTGITALAFFYLRKSRIVTGESLHQLHPAMMFLVYGFFLFSYLINSYVNYTLYAEVNGKWTLFDTFGDMMMGHLGSSITPFKSGYYPMKLYFQSKRGFTLEESLTAVTKTQIFDSLSCILFYAVLCAVLLLHPLYFSFQDIRLPFIAVILIGLGFHLLSLSFFCIMAYSRRLQHLLIRVAAAILYRLKRISKKEAYIAEQKQKMLIFKEQVRMIFHRFHRKLPLILLHLIFLVIHASLPYISYLLITGERYRFSAFFYCYLLSVAASYVNNIIPVPGGSGTSEIVFTMVYSNFIGDALLGSVLLLWRFSTFFLALLADLIFFFAFVFRKKRPETAAVSLQKEYNTHARK